MALNKITYTNKAATREQVGPDTANVLAADINEIKAVTNAAVDVVNANIVSIPADYVPGFPGGSQQQLFQFMFAAIEAGGGGAATPTGDTITLTTADFGLNLFDVVDAGIHKRSALAQTSFTTDATSVEIALVSLMAQVNADYITDSKVSVFDASGAFVGAVTPTQASGVQLLTLSLPGSGVRRYSLVEGGNTRGNSNTEFIGTYVQQIRRLNGTSIVKVAPVRKVNRAAAKVDSIGIGDGSSNNSRYAWTKGLRDSLPSTWEGPTISGWGGTYSGARLNTTQLQQDEADRIVAYMSGATGHKIYIDVDGTNAYGFSFDPELDAAYKASVWDKIHAADPEIKILAGTPLWRGNMATANSIGKVLADYATAYADAASTRDFVTLVDCLPWLSAADFTQPAGNGQSTDGLHPTDAGHALLATHWLAEINAAIAPVAGGRVDVDCRDVAPTLTATPGALEMVSATPGGALFKGIARGDKAIAAGEEGGVSFKIPVAGSDVFGGLGAGPLPNGYPDFKYSLYRLSDLQVFAYEGAAQTSVAATSADTDTYQVGLELDDDGALAVVYRINDAVVRTVAAPPDVDYYPVAALNAVGAKITNFQIFSDAPLVTY